MFGRFISHFQKNLCFHKGGDHENCRRAEEIMMTPRADWRVWARRRRVGRSSERRRGGVDGAGGRRRVCCSGVDNEARVATSRRPRRSFFAARIPRIAARTSLNSAYGGCRFVCLGRGRRMG
jgi:hypothetical protein